MYYVEIVTPRNARHFLERIEEGDPEIDHLCLELVHWKFEDLMSWIYKVHSACRNVTLSKPPPITIHSFGSEISGCYLNAITKSGAIWMPRGEKKNIGKDCATIIQEMLSCRSKPIKKPRNFPDEYEYDGIDNVWKPKEIPKEEFSEILERTIREIDE